MIGAWLACDTVPLPFSVSAVLDHATETLELVPRSPS